ncbi:glycosyltransferase [Nocardia sp. NBC_01499]|uniref:glycosyltransferase n=1 Tax=Nocardia sp. NBC_01499 TaxID=2903597 RepID=UPI00387034F7
MRVEVVTAVHAEYARYLPSAWRSLRAQTHPDWTWLVQVDGDAAAVRAALIECGAADDPRTRLAFNGTREGPAVTRNVALGRATATLIQNLDADDELEPTALAVLTTALRQHPTAGFTVGLAGDLLNSGELMDVPLPFEAGLLARGAVVDAWVTDPDHYRLPVHPAGVLWHRDLLLATGGWAAMRGMEDTGLLMSASALAPCVALDTRTLRYRRHRNQRSTQTSLFTGGCPYGFRQFGRDGSRVR